MKMIYLAPHDQKQLEAVLFRGIKECNNGIKRCNAEGNIRGAEYIREVKRRPLIKKITRCSQGDNLGIIGTVYLYDEMKGGIIDHD